MKRFDIFALASQWENQPEPLLGSMASGLPGLASNVEGIPEIVHYFVIALLADYFQVSTRLH